jgi:branched-chain amino acid transport system ATP-binding protein
MLQLSQVQLGYGKTEVIKGVSFKLKKGERVCVLGGNGSGKSTLMKAISGFIQPWKGQISFEEQVINGIPAHARYYMGIIYIPQDRKLFTSKTVYENLELGCLSLGISKKEVRRRIDKTVSYLPILGEKLHLVTGLLSGGEQQMVAMGRALIGNPKLLLIDEPSAGLAPVWIDRLCEVLRHLLAELKLTMILVEQNIHVGLEMSERGLVIQNGIVALERPSEELKGNDELIKSYLGEKL